MCGQLTAYNTYATLSYTKPPFLGFSCYQNVNKEIIGYDFSIKYFKSHGKSTVFRGFFI